MKTRALKVAENLALVRTLRLLAWVLLAIAGVSVAVGPPEWALEQMESGELPRALLLLPSIVFGVFLVLFAVYRFILARAGRYHPGRAFMQVGLAALVLTFLVPTNLEWYDEVAASSVDRVDLRPLLAHAEPAVRAAACEAAAARGRDPARDVAQLLAKNDPDPRVRVACAAVR